MRCVSSCMSKQRRVDALLSAPLSARIFIVRILAVMNCFLFTETLLLLSPPTCFPAAGSLARDQQSVYHFNKHISISFTCWQPQHWVRVQPAGPLSALNPTVWKHPHQMHTSTFFISTDSGNDSLMFWWTSTRVLQIKCWEVKVIRWGGRKVSSSSLNLVPDVCTEVSLFPKLNWHWRTS